MGAGSHEEEVKEVMRKMLWEVKIPVVGQKESVFWVYVLCSPCLPFAVE